MYLPLFINNMERLIKQRGMTKSKITRAATFLNNVCEQRRTASQELLATSLDLLNQAWREYSTISDEIIVTGSSEEVTAQELYLNEVEEKYVNTKTKLSEISKKLQNTQLLNHNKNNLSSAYPIVIASSRQETKLPSINIPTFLGDYLEWTAFSDMFNSLIHNNTQLSNVQKLHYLKSSLSGEAAALIHPLQTTDNNYEEHMKC